MKNAIQQLLILIPIAMTLSGTVLQAELVKSPDANTLWEENGIDVQTVPFEGTDFWTQPTWQAGGKWLSGGLYSHVTSAQAGGLQIQASGNNNSTYARVPIDPGYPYLVWDVVDIVPGEGYRAMGVGLDVENVARLSVVGNLQPGTFVFNPFLQDPNLVSRKVAAAVSLYNAALTIKGLRMVAQPENNLTITSPAFETKQCLDINDTITITLTLAQAAGSAKVEFFDSCLCTPVRLNDQEGIELKAADDTKKVWKATVDVKTLTMTNLKKGEQVKPNRLLLKATTSGGGLAAPLWTGNPYEFNLAGSVQVMGSPKFAAGKHGQALSFDGQSDALLIPCDINDKEGTMECWIHVSPTLETTANIFRIDGSNPWGYHDLSINAATRKLSYKVHADGTDASVTSASIGDGWHHVMATYSLKSGQIELFVDGNSEGTADYTVPTTFQGHPFGIGGYILGKVMSPYAGLIDEIRVSNVVRSAPANGAAPFEVDENTVVLIHGDRASGIKNAAE